MCLPAYRCGTRVVVASLLVCCVVMAKDRIELLYGIFRTSQTSLSYFHHANELISSTRMAMVP